MGQYLIFLRVRSLTVLGNELQELKLGRFLSQREKWAPTSLGRQPELASHGTSVQGLQSAWQAEGASFLQPVPAGCALWPVPGSGVRVGSGHSPHSSHTLCWSPQVGNFSLAALTSYSPLSFSVATQRPSVFLGRCPLSRPDQQDSRTLPSQPAPRSPQALPQQTVLLRVRRPTESQPLWPRTSFGEIQPQKRGPQMFFSSVKPALTDALTPLRCSHSPPLPFLHIRCSVH